MIGGLLYVSTSYTYVKFDTYDGYVPEAGLADVVVAVCRLLHSEIVPVGLLVG